jgi:glyoxylase-like metal-dependent hydrolase (beta-lactamase superfamily II)
MPLPVPFSVRSVNSYLFPGDPVTLVDPGADWPETLVELEASLARRGLRVEDVEQILITHQHHDHVGLAHRIKERSGAKLIASSLLVDYLPGLADVSAEAEDLYQAAVIRLHGVPEERIQELYEVSKAHRQYGGSVEVDVGVRDGDVIHAGGRRLLVAERPGHSPSDTLFIDEEEGWALGGDHLIATISSNPVVQQPLSRPADPRNRMRALVAYIDSMQRTAALDVRLILPGHGPEVERHGELVDERIEFHGRRKERLLEGLADGPHTVHELALGLWGDLAKREAFLTLSEAIGHLDLLEDEGRVRLIEGDDGLLRYEAVR